MSVAKSSVQSDLYRSISRILIEHQSDVTETALQLSSLEEAIRTRFDPSIYGRWINSHLTEEEVIILGGVIHRLYLYGISSDHVLLEDKSKLEQSLSGYPTADQVKASSASSSQRFENFKHLIPLSREFESSWFPQNLVRSLDNRLMEVNTMRIQRGLSSTGDDLDSALVDAGDQLNNAHIIITRVLMLVMNIQSIVTNENRMVHARTETDKTAFSGIIGRLAVHVADTLTKMQILPKRDSYIELYGNNPPAETFRRRFEIENITEYSARSLCDCLFMLRVPDRADPIVLLPLEAKNCCVPFPLAENGHSFDWSSIINTALDQPNTTAKKILLDNVSNSFNSIRQLSLYQIDDSSIYGGLLDGTTLLLQKFDTEEMSLLIKMEAMCLLDDDYLPDESCNNENSDKPQWYPEPKVVKRYIEAHTLNGDERPRTPYTGVLEMIPEENIQLTSDARTDDISSLQDGPGKPERHRKQDNSATEVGKQHSDEMHHYRQKVHQTSNLSTSRVAEHTEKMMMQYTTIPFSQVVYRNTTRNFHAFLIGVLYKIAIEKIELSAASHTSSTDVSTDTDNQAARSLDDDILSVALRLRISVPSSPINYMFRGRNGAFVEYDSDVDMGTSERQDTSSSSNSAGTSHIGSSGSEGSKQVFSSDESYSKSDRSYVYESPESADEEYYRGHKNAVGVDQSGTSVKQNQLKLLTRRDVAKLPYEQSYNENIVDESPGLFRRYPLLYPLILKNDQPGEFSLSVIKDGPVSISQTFKLRFDELVKFNSTLRPVLSQFGGSDSPASLYTLKFHDEQTSSTSLFQYHGGLVSCREIDEMIKEKDKELENEMIVNMRLCEFNDRARTISSPTEVASSLTESSRNKYNAVNAIDWTNPNGSKPLVINSPRMIACGYLKMIHQQPENQKYLPMKRGKFLLFEYLQPEEIKSKDLSESTCMMIIKEAQKTLDQIHAIGILHNDIHKSNIIFNSGKVSIIDYGRATFFNPSRMTDEDERAVKLEKRKLTNAIIRLFESTN